ncbi:MAG TPA: hypothetical protein VKM35_11855, partial [Arenimonas sp.]|nr:hypothetical protein [Arenimonas sp.]
MKRCSLALLAGVVLCVSSFQSIAADYKTEYDKKIKSAQDIGALGNDLAGDRVNFYTGGTSFNATDVSIPGNSGLSVAVGRFYTVEGNHQRAVTKGTSTPPEILGTVQRAFGDWDLDVPYLSTTMTQTAGWIVDSTTPQNRCSVVGQVRSDGSAANGAPPADNSAG